MKCNTAVVADFELGEDFSGGTKAEYFARTTVEQVLDLGQLIFSNVAQIGALG